MMYFVLFMNLLVVAGGTFICGLRFGDILNIPSFIFVFVPAFLAPFAAYGKSVYGKAMTAAFGSTVVKQDDKKSVSNVFRLIGNVGIGFGWVGALLGAIAMLKNLGAGDMSALGEGIAADIITIFYGYILKYGFCELAEYKIKQG